MTEIASQMVLGGLEAAQITKQERSFLKAHSPAGITLFSRNIASLEELPALLADLQTLSSHKQEPYLVAIDQEGGRVARIKDPHFPNMGPVMQITEGEDHPSSLKAINSYAKNMAEQLFKIGISINWAPVADVLTQDSNTCIGDRAWSNDPKKAALRAGAFLEGLQNDGRVFGCLKHFPGQGDGLFDTHKSPCIISAEKSLLFERELLPFKKLLSQTSFIMTSHAIYPSLDTKPATLSYKILTGLLREELNYTGIIVSDDLLMSAIVQDEQEWKEALVEAVAAGCDLLLVCQNLEKWQLAIEAIDNQRKKSSWFAEKTLASASKIHKIKAHLGSLKR